MVLSHLRVWYVRLILDMSFLEFRTILVETVGNKDRNIVEPGITRCCSKKDPVVSLGDEDKRFRPGPRSNNPLFVEYEEGIFHVLILVDVVPRVDVQYTGNRSVLRSPYAKLGELLFPVT